MAKTELTRQIERALFDWNPTVVSGIKINMMRRGFAATEVPVVCGTVTDGLVDFVSVQECLLDVHMVGGCLLNEERPFLASLTTEEAEEYYREIREREGCTVDVTAPSFRHYECDNAQCSLHLRIRQSTPSVMVTCVEIKITRSDFKSKHGHNFCGHCNYYAMPKDLYPQVQDLIPDDIGVLLFYNGENEEEKKRKINSSPFYGIRKKKDSTYRQLPEETQKWLVLSVAKRQIKESNERFDILLRGERGDSLNAVRRGRK